jgi:hypothetical protein
MMPKIPHTIEVKAEKGVIAEQGLEGWGELNTQ